MATLTASISEIETSVMVRIYRSTSHLGNRTCIEHDPTIGQLKDHIFNPDSTLGCPGVYDYGRKLVLQSVYSRGPDPVDVLPVLQPRFTYEEITEWAHEETYIFLGLLHPHFGHFLLSTFSRLWNIRDLPPHKILCVAPSHLSEPAKPYVRDLLKSLDIDPARLVSFAEPVKIRQIILPFPSFEEQNFVHRAFARLCVEVGDQLTAGASRRTVSDRPIYLSKENIKSGVRKIINEADICAYLASAGLEIVSPETLSFSEQVALWRTSRPVVAFSSSALHTSVFSRGSKLISLNHDRQINSSFSLIDWACDTDASYFHFEPGTFEDLGPSEDFVVGQRGMSDELRARDPRGIADAILRAIDAKDRVKRRKAGLKELAIGCPTSQSSSSHEDDSSGLSATSGIITGRYQFHTKHEVEPWWQVDLGCVVDITGLCVYNRTDAGVERSAGLRVYTSLDGVSFSLAFVRSDDAPFGGLNGSPLSIELQENRRGRFIRLMIPGPEFFHLDQVEVFGHRPNEKAQDQASRSFEAIRKFVGSLGTNSKQDG